MDAVRVTVENEIGEINYITASIVPRIGEEIKVCGKYNGIVKSVTHRFGELGDDQSITIYIERVGIL